MFVEALVALSLGFGLFLMQVDASPVCPAASAFQALVDRGNDARMGLADRRKAYEQAVQLCPDRTEAYHSLSALLREQHDFEGALYWTRRGLSQKPGDAQLRLDEATGLILAGQARAALASLNKLPESATREFYLGMAYRALKEHRAAQEAFSAAVKLGYDDPYVFYVLLEQDRALHDKAAGLRDFKGLDNRFPDSPWLHLVLGDAYMNRHDYENARSEYDKSSQMAPTLPVVHFKLGYLAFVRGNYVQAAQELRREIGLDPGFGEAFLYLGVALRRQGKIGEAVPLLKEAVALDSNSSLAYSALAAAERESNQTASALATLRAAERRFPNDATFPAQRAALLREIGRKNEAEREAALAETLSRRANPLRRAVGLESSRTTGLTGRVTESGVMAGGKERRPEGQSTEDTSAQRKAEALTTVDSKYPQPRRLILEGQVYMKSGDLIPAIRSFLEAATLEPRSPEPFYYLGTSFFLIGERTKSPAYYERAEQNFKTALELSPQYDRAEFMLGVIAAMQSRLSEAQEYLEKAIQMKPSNPYYHLHYGILLKHLGKDTPAVKEIRVAEALNPSYALTHFELGSIYERMGNYTEARQQLESAISLNSHLSVAYYHLGVVYSRLGLPAKSSAAYRKFRLTKGRQGNESSSMVAIAEE